MTTSVTIKNNGPRGVLIVKYNPEKGLTAYVDGPTNLLKDEEATITLHGTQAINIEEGLS